MIWIGTSGWSYGDWEGRFYPDGLPARSWLPSYAERFPTVELNNSFYRLPDRSVFLGWHDATPEGFLFAVKVSRYLTHLKRLRDPAEPVARLTAAAEGLGSKLGPYLLQLPPRFPAERERLETTLRAMPAGARVAVEFRDPSWYADEVYAVLDAMGAALVVPDRSGDTPELPLTGGWAYLRFHQGRPDAAGYTADTLARWADRIASLDADEVFAYFNNDPGAAAPRDAAHLRALLLDRVPDRVVTVEGASA